MCMQVIERYHTCRCIYHVHAVDPCSAVDRRDHRIQRREVLVGNSCSRHKSKAFIAKPISAGSQSEDSGYGTGSSIYAPSEYDHSITDKSEPTGHERNDFSNLIGKSSLRTQLLKKIVNALTTDEQFIPAGDLRAVLTADAVKQELQSHEMEQLLPKIVDNAKKVFAILLVIGRVDALQPMVEAGLGDGDLPLTMYGYLEKNQPYSEFFSYFAEWDAKAQERFIETQWTFMAPVFKDGEHQRLDDGVRLPFTNMERIGTGSYGAVHRVTIHIDHCEFETPSVLSTSKGRTFALKRFIQHTREANFRIFNNELAIMKSLRYSNITHITKVLASFEHKGHYFMILPLAEENLRQFWAHSQSASFTSNWYLEEMGGVSSGLSVLHQAAGWHNDLKPENILVFRDGSSCKPSLHISDFGISYIHPKGSKSDLPPHPGTGTYEPPECQMNQKHSQKYDIWSLGCIFLECLVWALKGSEAIESFADDRLKDTPASDENFRNDYFFSLELNESLTPSGAQIRPAVLRWIEALDRDPNCSPAISETLRLIRDGLLQVQQGRRLDASQISETLLGLVHISAKEHILSGSSISPRSPDKGVTELR